MSDYIKLCARKQLFHFFELTPSARENTLICTHFVMRTPLPEPSQHVF